MEAEYPEQVDLLWLAADHKEQVAAFLTAGEGPVPQETLRIRVDASRKGEMALGKLDWTRVGKCCEARDEKLGLRATGGAGGLGGDGFITIESDSSGAYTWSAFFENSNSFDSLLFQGQHVVGLTSLGDQWVFPIKSPADFRIVRPSASGVPSDLSAAPGGADRGEEEA